MKYVKFNEECEDKRAGVTFLQDTIHRLRDDSAMHWIKRGKAAEVFPAFEPAANPKPDEAPVPEVAEAMQEAASVDEKPQRGKRKAYGKHAVDPES